MQHPLGGEEGILGGLWGAWGGHSGVRELASGLVWAGTSTGTQPPTLEGNGTVVNVIHRSMRLGKNKQSA